MCKNKLSIIGTGYVGLVGGVCLADFGNRVINVDINEDKINRLNRGEVPIYEPGLREIMERNVKDNRISFTTDIKIAVEESEVIFISVGTPDDGNGRADLQHVLKVAETIGHYMNDYKIIVDKSTVPVGTGRKVAEVINKELQKRNEKIKFDVVSNPEFLREGKAVYDFTHPDRIVIGTESKKAREILKEVYRPLYLNNIPFVFSNIETAEMIKYASNAFLATKISYINEMAILCEKVNANVQQVAKTMGMDGRIGDKFLHSGPGYGGSCFPKDTNAIVKIAEDKGVELQVIKAGIEANKKQKLYIVEKIKNKLGELKGKNLGILGLSFKPETDDMREAPALTIIPELIEKGAKIKAYDPQAMEEAAVLLSDYEKDILYCANEYEVMKGADAVVIITEWNQFRRLDLLRVKKMLKTPVFFDLRNVYEPQEVSKAGIDYIGVGVPAREAQEVIDVAERQIASTDERE